MEGRKVPRSSVEREVPKSSSRLSSDERHFESCSPSGTTGQPGDAVGKGPISNALFPSIPPQVMVWLRTSEAFSCL